MSRWFAREKRDLPWRRTRDPYAVWVSEVMLQQTRVEVVARRFRGFLEEFPSPAALASTPEESVLAAWSGLGYYTRARNLRRGAARVEENHEGAFPRDLEAARKIPGVGRYTAAAVLSIAYGLPHAVVDGNVARVLARLFRIEPPHDRSAAHLETLAHALLDPDNPADHNQAMMELGATVCLPRNPRCADCPVAKECVAHRDRVTDSYPTRKPRPSTIERRVVLYLLRDDRGRLLLERNRWPLLAHLWLPPMVDVPRAEHPGHRHHLAVGRPAALHASVDFESLKEAGSFRHSITRHRLRILVVTGGIASGPGTGRPTAGFRLCDEAALRRIGRSSLLEKALGIEAAFRR